MHVVAVDSLGDPRYFIPSGKREYEAVLHLLPLLPEMLQMLPWQA